MASSSLGNGTSRQQLSRAALVERLKGVKLLSLDVDGVLTDGGLYYPDDGQQLRKFNVKDGMGLQRVHGDNGLKRLPFSRNTPINKLMPRMPSVGRNMLELNEASLMRARNYQLWRP